MPIRELPADNDDREGRVVLTEKDAREAARLLRLLADAGGQSLPDVVAEGDLASPESLVSRAHILFQSRRDRYHHFNRAMFGEPAWDTLLALYINDLGGRRLTASRLAELIEEPFSTVFRWIDYLEKERLIERVPHPNDKRTTIIRLLEKGRKSMEDYLVATD